MRTLDILAKSPEILWVSPGLQDHFQVSETWGTSWIWMKEALQPLRDVERRGSEVCIF